MNGSESESDSLEASGSLFFLRDVALPATSVFPSCNCCTKSRSACRFWVLRACTGSTGGGVLGRLVRVVLTWFWSLTLSEMALQTFDQTLLLNCTSEFESDGGDSNPCAPLLACSSSSVSTRPGEAICPKAPRVCSLLTCLNACTECQIIDHNFV